MRRGFSLVELSIVLLILGLLTGGVLVGRDLIRAAELRSVITEKDQYVAAVLAFRLKYSALPGDMRNATTFLGGQASNCSPASYYGQTLTGGTCNGNGNGSMSAGAEIAEKFYAWHHLAAAGLIEGSYRGLSGAGHYYDDAAAGINVPESRVGGGVGWCFERGWYGIPWVFNVNYTNVLTFGNTGGEGALNAQAGTCYASPFPFIPEEAWNIDDKIDDGMPARGRVIASQITRCTDAWTSVNNFDAKYSLTGGFASARECGLFFRDLQ